jgi:hypothetical protein
MAPTTCGVSANKNPQGALLLIAVDAGGDAIESYSRGKG